MAIKWLSVAKYADQTGLSPKAVREMIDKGELIATEVGEGAERKHLKVKVETVDGVDELKQQIADLTELVSKLTKHLGVST